MHPFIRAIIFCGICAAFTFTGAPVFSQPAQDSPRLSGPISFSAGEAAADRWDYDRAEIIFEQLSHLPGPRRTEAERWLRRIERIRNSSQPLLVRTGDTWEYLALRSFQDVSYAARLAAYNHSLIINRPVPDTEVLIPLVHLEASRAMKSYDNPHEAPLTDLAMGIAHMRRTLELDPEYPGIARRLSWADEVYTRRTTVARVDSLESAVDSLVEIDEFTEAINSLQVAQSIIPDQSRRSRIQRLRRLRREMIPVWFDRGNELFREDDLNGALENWRKVVEVDPNYRDVQARIERVENILRTIGDLPDDDPDEE